MGRMNPPLGLESECVGKLALLVNKMLFIHHLTLPS